MFNLWKETSTTHTIFGAAELHFETRFAFPEENVILAKQHKN